MAKVHQVDQLYEVDGEMKRHTQTSNKLVAQPVDHQNGSNNYKKSQLIATSRSNTPTTKKVVFVDLCDSGD